jgi:hypothetical protein
MMSLQFVVDSSYNSRDFIASTGTNIMSVDDGPKGYLPKSFQCGPANYDSKSQDPTLEGLLRTNSATILFRASCNSLSTSNCAFSVGGTRQFNFYPNDSAVATGGTRIYYGSNKISEAGPNLAGSGWIDCAFVTRASNNHEAYRNAVSIGTSNNSDNVSSVSGTVTIGRYGPSQPFVGRIAEVAMLGVALTTNEIEQWGDGPEPINLTPPSISGIAATGETLTCYSGVWDIDPVFGTGNNGTILYSYQWMVSDDELGGGETPIDGAESSTYVVTEEEAGRYIRCLVRGTNNGGYDSAADTYSNITGVSSILDITPPDFQSAAINTSGNELSITFSEAVIGQSGFSLTASSGAISLGSSYGDSGVTHYHSLSRIIGSGETVTVSYSDSLGDSQDASGNLLATFTNSGVTNNSTQDIQDPTVASAAINGAGTTLTINFHEACSGSTGFSLSATDGDPTLSGVTVTGVAHTYTTSRDYRVSRVCNFRLLSRYGH